MVEKKEKGVIKALVRAVNSGDFIQLQRSSKTPPEQNVYLASIKAPQVGSQNKVEEPFAFEAREFLRERVVGRKCEFHIEYNINNKDYGTLIVDGENINLALVKSGLVKVIEKKGNMQAASNYEQLANEQAEAKKKRLGIWQSEDEKFLEKHKRNVTYFGDSGYNAAKLLEEAKTIDKPLQSIVEYVFNASFLSLYIYKFQTVAKLSLVHMFTPQQDKELVQEGKHFVEKLLLHRTVGVKFERVEEGGVLVGRIFHPAGDISFEVLKNGLAKLNMPKNIEFDADYFKTLKEAQLVAQKKQVRIWKDFKVEESKQQQKASTTDFTGHVVEVHTGDSLTIERESDLQQIRVFLATVKAPILLKKPGEDPDAYAWDAKEALRKATIGKRVKVVMEFSKTVKSGETERNMDFASVFLDKNEKNVSCILLEKGLLKTNVTKSGDNASKFLEDLLSSEKKGTDHKVGIHSNKPAPIRIFDDLVQNPKKSRDFEAMVMKRPDRRMNGVVEVCFSGMRFKVRLDGENIAIALNILGVRTMPNDKNQPQFLELSQEALHFAKQTLNQRDVIIEPHFADKKGSFFGSIQLANNKKDFALMLVQEGLAQISVVGNRLPYNFEQLEDAEDQAKQDGIGIWSKSVKILSASSPKKVRQNERIQVEMTDITDASSFFVRVVGENQYSKVEQLMNQFNPLDAEDIEKPVKKGTICAARFKVDGNWYRSRILRGIGKNQYEVEFIDFGNQDTVSGDDLKRLSQSILQYEPQAKRCSLAYIKVPRVTSKVGEQAARFVQNIAMDQVTDAIVVDQQGDHLSVVLFPKGEKDWNKSVNCDLIGEGLAQIQKLGEDDDEYPEEINQWFEIEEEVKDQNLGIWEYGGAQDDDDDN